MYARRHTTNPHPFLKVFTPLAIVAMIVFAAGAVSPMSAQGDPLIVTKTADMNDGVCDTDCSLREAMIIANTLPGPDTIILPAGTYTLTIAGAGENAATTGDLDITDSVTITGAGASDTIIDGNGFVLNDRVFHVIRAGTVTISGITIRNGVSSGIGGAIPVGAGIRNDGSVLNITRSILTNNTGGGAIANRAEGILTIADTVIVSNSSGAGGGGIFSFSGTITVTGSVIISNITSGADVAGGGIAILSGDLTIMNSTLSDNRATGDGGGIAVLGGSLSLNNVTIANNTADNDNDGAGDGGGVAVAPGNTVVFRNTIIGGNTDRGEQAPDCSGTLESRGYNLISAAAGCTIEGITDGNLIGVDPRLGTLRNNGGDTLTHALLPGSPAIEGGNPLPPGSSEDACEVTDQRGVPRPQWVRCDIGAFEFVPNKLYLPLIHRS